jgi:hypothetical protein
MATDEKEKEQAAPSNDPLESLGISRRRLAYVAPVILLSRKMLYRATTCGKSGPSGACKFNRRNS